MELNVKTTYRFSEADLKFAIELAKIGDVHLLSDQVTLKSHDNKSNLSFKEYGDNGSDGLQIPANWFIEWIGSKGDIVNVTFGIKPK